METQLIGFIFLAYFALLLGVSYFVNKKSADNTFYDGDRKSPWFVVAFGMIGATLSGVTFISVPGEVGNTAFHYFQFVLGNFVGYIIIATLLLPYYYRKNILSIYSVLEQKMGRQGYLTSSAFFIVSKVIGAAFRLYLAALVIQLAIAEQMGIPFELTVLLCLLVIYLYTVKSGIKMVVWSDVLQTLLLLTSVAITIVILSRNLELDFGGLSNLLLNDQQTQIFEFDLHASSNFFKQFFAGIFITIAINGFDQDIMQKNLTCSSPANARKNMLVFSILFVLSVFVFLIVGALLYRFAAAEGIAIPAKTDELFPMLALRHLGMPVAILFVLGISAAAISSADSATTALTTAFCVDFLGFERKKKAGQQRQRSWVHLGFVILIYLVIVFFYKLNNDSVIVAIFKAAGYTYGPILGIFAFAFFIERIPNRKIIVPIALLSPIFTWLLTLFIQEISDYRFGFELIIVNAALTFSGLFLFSRQKESQ